jgi:molybdopterin molybdotransferase
VGSLISIDEARRRVHDAVRPLAEEDVALDAALGRVLAEDVSSAIPVPPFDSSAMDGYALRAADTPGTLPVVARIAAGRPAPRPLEGGEAMAIATGGAVPEGADAVIQLEVVTETDAGLHVPEPVAPETNVRPRGGDVVRDAPVVAGGTRIAPAQLGALAAAGIARVQVAGRPRVAVLATGSELRPPGVQLEPGQIYDANGLMLLAQSSAAGARTDRLEAVADDEAAHRHALERGLGYDVLVSSGGVSVGPHDLVRSVGADLGVREVFWGIAMRPGKPLWFGVREATLVFGLPGNPVSSLVCFQLFVRPALLALQGERDPRPRFELGRLARRARRNAARDDLVRARRAVTEDGIELEPVGGQESHMIARAAEADALVLVPRGDGEIAAGESVRFLPLD